ncbi:MAG: hypothetical protein JW882_09480 [Deltaproteobacteria bacterium]|nr:hypothetical protein [Deltaproteobacteria bacterium]
MIVKMKSIAVLGQQRCKDEILYELRDIGVLHVSHVKQPEGAAIDSLKEEISKVTTVLGWLPVKQNEEDFYGDSRAIAGELYNVVTEIRTANEEITKLKREAEKAAAVGAFNPQDIQYLSARGIGIRLYECPVKKLPMLPESLLYAVIGKKDRAVAVIAVISMGKEFDIPLAEIGIPPRSIDQIKEMIERKASRLADLRTKLEMHSSARKGLNEYLRVLQDQRELEMVKYGMGNTKDIFYIKGFCPADRVGRLKEAGDRNSWGLVLDDPGDAEDPPTLMKNSPFVRIVKPLYKLLGTTPGYREYDVNWCFLSFFCVFFAMIISDAGYGAVFMILTALAHYKLRDRTQARDPFYLMYLLSGCTIIWGSLSGMWFSSRIISELYPFRAFVSPKFSVFSPASQENVMNLCFILAVMQFSIAHGMAALRNRRNIAVLAQVGWLIYMWGIFFLTGNLVLGLSMPKVAVYLLGTGFLLVFLFANAKKTFKKTVQEILLTLLPTLLGFVGAFADTVSYLRLFAVGLTGFALASSFHEIVSQIGFDSVIAGFFSVVILVLVHCLNMALVGLGVLVHGLRLNMLEFSSHLGMTWSGYEYNPFRKTAAAG